MFDTLHDIAIETALPDAETLQRLETRLHLDPEDKWTRLFSIRDSSAGPNNYRFTIVDRFWGHIGVKVKGTVQGGKVSGRFRLLLVERLFFLLTFGLCVLLGVSFISQGQITAFLNIVIAFFFTAFVYVYRALRFRDLISRSMAKSLDGKIGGAD